MASKSTPAAVTPASKAKAQKAFEPKEAKPEPKKCCDKCMNLAEAKQLVKENNRSKKLSDELVLCLIWKESNFCPKKKAKKSSATGLTQMTKGAVKEVNKTGGEQFSHDNMTDGGSALRAGTRYMDMRVKWAGGDVGKGLNWYGTGKGYSDNIKQCEACMQAGGGEQSCLNKIHG